jgi:hypothetical protein
MVMFLGAPDASRESSECDIAAADMDDIEDMQLPLLLCFL